MRPGPNLRWRAPAGPAASPTCNAVPWSTSTPPQPQPIPSAQQSTRTTLQPTRMVVQSTDFAANTHGGAVTSRDFAANTHGGAVNLHDATLQSLAPLITHVSTRVAMHAHYSSPMLARASPCMHTTHHPC
jgi:hypothetical protein